MEDSVCERMYLITAVFTLVALAIAHSIIARLYKPAVMADFHIAMVLLEHIVQTGVVIWE